MPHFEECSLRRTDLHLAKDDPDAQGRAKDWVAFLETRWEDAWLILNISGRGITLKPGEF